MASISSSTMPDEMSETSESRSESSSSSSSGMAGLGFGVATVFGRSGNVG